MKNIYRNGFSDAQSGNPRTTMQTQPRRPNWLRIVAMVVLLALCGAVAVDAQQPSKVTRIGWFRVSPGGSPGGQSELTRRLFRELGYIEGKNIVFDYRYTDGKLDRLPGLADELVRRNVDLIHTSSVLETIAAKNATKTIPIVFVGGFDPVAAGLVDSFARPGGNITGFTSITGVLAGKRLELLKETVPKLSRVAVLWNPRDPSSLEQWKESLYPARELGLQLHSMEVSTDIFESAFKAAVKTRSAALAVTQSSYFNRNQKLIAELAVKYRLPSIYGRGDYVDSGGLMSYGADREEPYKRMVWMVDKIIKGAQPADIPVEQPMRFELALNLNTAKTLGLTIPPIVLMRVTKAVK